MTIKELKTILNQLPEHYEIKANIIESDFGDLEITDIIQGRDEDDEPQNMFMILLEEIS